MSDFYFDETGDIRVASNGDIAHTETERRNVAQQTYIRMMTQPRDFLLYPNFGIDLDSLKGQPQNARTGDLGRALIMGTLKKDPYFKGRNIKVNAVPTGPQTIRFDIYVTVGIRDELALQVEADLGVTE